jgi:proteasome assembly chaperone (PAC2) family protein
MDYLQMDSRPDLRDPIAVVAFAGWNDAASAATNAARFLVRRLAARKFATIDADPFFDFKETRPTVRVSAAGVREITWPGLEFFYARRPTGPHDVVVTIGVEPNLRWRAFTGIYSRLFADLGVTLAVSLGALMADVPHTRPVRVTGTAADPDLAARLDLSVSRYEGPTGIVGVLHDALRQEGLPAASLWANVPHYVTTAQNPPATLALLRRLQTILAMEFDYKELLAASDRFIGEVDSAVSGNREIAEYVSGLERAADTLAGRTEAGPAEPLPEGEDLVMDVEEFLRGNRPGD